MPIKIELLGYTRRDYFPGALALCHPFGGLHGEIFDDRIRFMIEAAALPYVLGHVLAHEITHLITQTDSHSDDGVMKALWTTRDYRRMIQSPLPFTDEDILLIHLGLSERPEAW